MSVAMTAHPKFSRSATSRGQRFSELSKESDSQEMLQELLQ
jgi:hypothetical protein